MTKINKVHCFFEQSGTFKHQFQKLGFDAYDYDIQNEYGETDYVCDLFSEIESAFDGKPSIFDLISKDDLIMAFFPCIFFSCQSQMGIYFSYVNYRNYSTMEKAKAILQRSANREKFFALAVKMFAVALDRGLRLIMENPWSEQTFLKNNFVLPPSYVDMDRSKRGDYFKKPTAFWFLNCDPHNGYTFTPNRNVKRINDCKRGKAAGICSKERSEISPLYAYNFICDQIIGCRNTNEKQLTLFDNL